MHDASCINRTLSLSISSLMESDRLFMFFFLPLSYTLVSVIKDGGFFCCKRRLRYTKSCRGVEGGVESGERAFESEQSVREGNHFCDLINCRKGLVDDISHLWQNLAMVQRFWDE
ncbi:unnamed protein product [Cuscuta epithymum]|uniref:Uncharacterized protein n=1 Tax=Cuscuta epithymum TaxID=186058 RepID=A0AAV0E7M9_9ASTE|nr:unnamed protein product [Cuscuta epithymum]CAH9144857.1 unnamed protein product [Cuscuta epithymum]